MEEAYDDTAEMELKDPNEMTSEERRQALIEGVRQDDLLGVLLYLGAGDESNTISASDTATVLQVAVTTSSSNLRVRIFIVECLLHRGFDTSLASNGQPELVKAVTFWSRGGRERAVDSKHLLEIAADNIFVAESWINEAGLGDGHEVEMENFEGENAQPGEAIKREEETTEEPAEEEEKDPVKADPQDLMQVDKPTSTTVSQEDSISFHSLPRPLPQPPSPVRSDLPLPPSRSAQSLDPCLVRIIHLPFSLRKHVFHDFVLRRIRVHELVSIEIRYNSEQKEAVGYVEVDREKARSILIDQVDGQKYQGRVLGAFACSSINEESEEEDPYAPPRPPVPTRPRPRPRSQSPTSRWSNSNHRSPSRSHTSRRSQSPPRTEDFDPSRYVWLSVCSLPTSWSQRKIYEKLESHNILPKHIILNRPPSISRNAFVAVSSSSDVSKACKVLVDSEDGIRASLYEPPPYGPQVPYPSSACKDRPYLPPSESIRLKPYDPRRIVVKYLPAEATRTQIIDFVESRTGKSTIKDFQTFGVAIKRRLDSEQIAEVGFWTKDKAIEAIKILDGTLFSGIAIGVEWSESPKAKSNMFDSDSWDRHDRRTSQSSPRRRSRSPPPRRHSLSPPRPLSNGTPDTPPRRTASPDSQLAMDLSRIRSLNLSLEDLEAIQRIWTPLEAPPRSPHQDFNREVDVNVKFGFLPRSEALSALEDKDPVFPEDPLLEKRYRSFLEGQAGVSRDYYTIFFAQLFDWNVHSEMFANRGKEIAAKKRRKAEEEGRREERKR
ncbi:hypothetical protein JCM5350_005107 [Sporobolomyces pararoseus]